MGQTSAAGETGMAPKFLLNFNTTRYKFISGSIRINPARTHCGFTVYLEATNIKGHKPK